jgi:uncharacterized protein YdhG (YjbR/CyaY superfamily)
MAEKSTRGKSPAKQATKARSTTKAKSAKSTTGAATPKPKAKPAPKMKTIDDYMAPFPEEVRGRLQLIRMKVQELAPQAKESISYGIPTFKLNDTYLVYFGGWKDYISMYPLPAGNPEFDEAIEPYKAAKSTARFPHKQPLPLPLIETIVRLSLAENAARSAGR